MLIGGFFIIRILVASLLLSVEESFKKSLEISEVAKTNFQIIAWILVASFEETYKDLEVEELEIMRTQVRLGRKIFPRSDVLLSCKVIPGCPASEEIRFFDTDLEGKAKLEEFITRIIENLYAPSLDLYYRTCEPQSETLIKQSPSERAVDDSKV